MNLPSCVAYAPERLFPVKETWSIFNSWIVPRLFLLKVGDYVSISHKLPLMPDLIRSLAAVVVSMFKSPPIIVLLSEWCPRDSAILESRSPPHIFSTFFLSEPSDLSPVGRYSEMIFINLFPHMISASFITPPSTRVLNPRTLAWSDTIMKAPPTLTPLIVGKHFPVQNSPVFKCK